MHRPTPFKFGLLIAFIVASIIISLKVYYSFDLIANYFNSLGIYKTLVVFLFVVVSAALGLPIIVPNFVAALSFGFIKAVVLISIGVTLGSIISFYLTRFLGRDYMEKKAINKIKALKKFDMNIETHGFWIILLLRLISILPFQVVNLIGGISRVRLRYFVAATFIGPLPGTLAFVYLFKSFGTGNFFFALSLCGLLTLLPLLSSRVRAVIFG